MYNAPKWVGPGAGRCKVKRWYLSKTVWAALITGAIGTYIEVDRALGGSLPDVPGVVLVVLSALGLYGRTKANAPIVWKDGQKTE